MDVINDLNGKETIGAFYENELQKANQKEFRIKKVIRKKGNKLYGEGIIIHLIAKLIEKTQYKWVNTFLNHMNHLEETLISKLICLIMQQKQI